MSIINCSYLGTNLTRLVSFLQVQHSQRLNETLLSCWIIIESSGEVCCVHCTYMAGLGETYTHIAAILFYLEATARIQGTTTTCTQQTCQWIIPVYSREMNIYQSRTQTLHQLWERKGKQIKSQMPWNQVLVNAQKLILPQGEKRTESEMANFLIL